MTRSAKVNVLCESCDDTEERKKARDVPDKIEHAAAQTSRATKTRADRDVDFFFIRVFSVLIGRPL